MPQVSMSPQTFQNLEEQVGQHPEQFTSFTKTGPTTGIIVTKDVTIDYNYSYQTQFMGFNIGAKHSLAAKIAGDNVIANHIVALIHNLPPVEPKAPVAEPELTPVGTPEEIPAAVIDGAPAVEAITGESPLTPQPELEVANGGTGS